MPIARPKQRPDGLLVPFPTNPAATLRQEYVSADARRFGTAMRSLPRAHDDLTRDFTDDIYHRMGRDPQIAAVLRLLVSAIFSEPLTFSAAVEDESEADFAAAQDMAMWCEQFIADLVTPIDDALKDILRGAMSFGNKAAELVYADVGGQLVPVAVKPRPRDALGFVVDPFNNVVGFLVRTPTSSAFITSGPIVDPHLLPNFLPREKFAVLTWEPVDGDPRGTSILRAAYGPWNAKVQALGAYTRYLAQVATPSLVATMPENATAVQAVDTSGNVVIVAPQQYMLTSLAEFQNGSVVVLPFGATVKPIEMQGDGSAYLKAFEFENSEMVRAVLSQTLATNEAKHGTRAQASVHQDVLGLIVAAGKDAVCRMIERDILKPTVRMNHGPDAERLTPRASVGEVDRTDVDAIRLAVAALATAGYLDPSQLPALDREMDLPARSEEDLTQRQVAAATPPPPVPDPNAPALGETPPKE